MVDARIEMTEKQYQDFLEKQKKEKMRRAIENPDVEPVATPEKPARMIGKMQAAPKGSKPSGGAISEYKKNGYDAQTDEPVEESFMEKHPKLAKAVDIGKKTVGVVNKKVSEYIENVQKSDEKFKEMQGGHKEEEEEPEEKKSLKKKSSKKKSKGKLLDEDDFDFDDEDDSDIMVMGKSTSKQKVLPGSYKTAYGGQGGLFGKRGYESVYKSQLGGGAYQPAYKMKMAKPDIEQPETTIIGEKKRTKSAVEEMVPTVPEVPTTPARKPEPKPDRFNTKNWQSLGFPNTLPQGARGALFRPAQEHPMVVPMVRQPYQPRAVPAPMPRVGGALFNQQPSIATPRAQMPRLMVPNIGNNLPRVATPTKHTPKMQQSIPRVGEGLISTLPQKKEQKSTNVSAPPISIFGVPVFKKKK